MEPRGEVIAKGMKGCIWEDKTQAVVRCLQAFWETGDLVVAKAGGFLLRELRTVEKLSVECKGRISRLKCADGN